MDKLSGDTDPFVDATAHDLFLLSPHFVHFFSLLTRVGLTH